MDLEVFLAMLGRAEIPYELKAKDDVTLITVTVENDDSNVVGYG